MARVDRPTRHLVRRHRVAIERESPPAATRAREPGPPGRLLRSAGSATVNLAPPFAAPFIVPERCDLRVGTAMPTTVVPASLDDSGTSRSHVCAPLGATQRRDHHIQRARHRDRWFSTTVRTHTAVHPLLSHRWFVVAPSFAARRRISAPAGSGPWRWAGPPARMQGRRTHVWRAGAPTALQVQSQPCVYGRSGSMRAVIGRPRRHRAAQLHGAATRGVRAGIFGWVWYREPQAKKRGWGDVGGEATPWADRRVRARAARHKMMACFFRDGNG